jgi:hypothetical protein
MRLNELIAKLEEIRDELERQGKNTNVKVTVSTFEFYSEVMKVKLIHWNGEDEVFIEDGWNGYETLQNAVQ